jgi:hypothetical protein
MPTVCCACHLQAYIACAVDVAADVPAQVRAIIGSFGQLKAFSLLRDASGQSTGSALAEFADPGVLNAAVAGLSVLSVGSERLTVARAANQEHVVALQQLVHQQQAALTARLTGRPFPAAVTAVALPSVAPAPAAAAAAAAASALTPPQQAAAGFAGVAGTALDGAAAAAGGGSEVVKQASAMARADSAGAGLCVVRLEHMVVRDELLDDEDYEDILEETRDEVLKYGSLKQVGVQ